MLIRLLTAVAGPNFDYRSGTVADVDSTWGEQMVQAGNAERVSDLQANAHRATVTPPPAASPVDGARQATVTPPQQASSRRRNRAGRNG